MVYMVCLQYIEYMCYVNYQHTFSNCESLVYDLLLINQYFKVISIWVWDMILGSKELTQSFTEEKKGLDFSPRSGEATSGEK